MLKPAEHLFPTINTAVEYYINYASDGDPQFSPGEIVYTVIQWFSDHRFHRRVSDTHKFCELLNMSPEDTLIWVLKYGDTLPHKLDEVTA